jgi:hypothetical protein
LGQSFGDISMDKNRKNINDKGGAEDDKFPLEPKLKPEKKEIKPVSLGTGDAKPLAGGKVDQESGMYMGPYHPYFRKPIPHPDVDAPSIGKDGDGNSEPSPYPFPEKRLPRNAHPTGARFDPITPFGEGFSGEPDNDELLPPPQRGPSKPKRQPGAKKFDPFDPSTSSGGGGDPSSFGPPFFK